MNAPAPQDHVLKFGRILLDEYKTEESFELDLRSYHYEDVIEALKSLGCKVEANGTPWKVTVSRPLAPVKKIRMA